MGTVVQQPFEFGRQSILLMSKTDSKQIFIPTKAINKENVDAFSAELKALLGQN